MKHLFSLLTVFTLLTISCNEKTKHIQQCFDNYKKSILESNGQKAIKFVDKHTLEYYKKILQFSILADSSEVQNLGLLDKLMVLMVRHRIPKDELLQMDGNSFFTYAVDNGMISKNSVMNIELGQIDVDGNFAKGQIVVNGQKAPFYFHFYNENNIWKIDLTSIFTVTTAGFKKIISDNGQTENDFIAQILETLTGRPMSLEIWSPLDKK